MCRACACVNYNEKDQALGAYHCVYLSENDLCLCCQETGFKYKFCRLLWSWCGSWHWRAMLPHPSHIKPCLRGITDKEVRWHLCFVPVSNHKWWADVRKLSSPAPSLEIMRMALLMAGHLLFFSGPLGTMQWNCGKLGKLLPAWFMAIASSLFPHFHKHQILLENLGENLPILGYFGVSSSSLDLWFDKPNNKMKNGFCSLAHDYQPHRQQEKGEIKKPCHSKSKVLSWWQKRTLRIWTQLPTKVKYFNYDKLWF